MVFLGVILFLLQQLTPAHAAYSLALCQLDSKVFLKFIVCEDLESRIVRFIFIGPPGGPWI
eukprot:NODE_4672_length_455_cov_279.857143_g4031_i0.p1 GENE.NODE_4672_length_455_cov_279.857143_g4031_i0~~NODE_4672_length_455_cov_279.857143_g4031_i0.p1  ORF type:complete len:61 (+),score=0.53 NODE_4672_length_455_cov_279.857143_g4031_i0:195-377(+)